VPAGVRLPPDVWFAPPAGAETPTATPAPPPVDGALITAVRGAWVAGCGDAIAAVLRGG
jgi:hypothetical protein